VRSWFDACLTVGLQEGDDELTATTRAHERPTKGSAQVTRRMGPHANPATAARLAPSTGVMVTPGGPLLLTRPERQLTALIQRAILRLPTNQAGICQADLKGGGGRRQAYIVRARTLRIQHVAFVTRRSAHWGHDLPSHLAGVHASRREVTGSLTTVARPWQSLPVDNLRLVAGESPSVSPRSTTARRQTAPCKDKPSVNT
jgi:hypothetical protein